MSGVNASLLTIVIAPAAFATHVARADEGMWLFNDFPSAEVKRTYGFAPDAQWLDRVRLGSIRLANGCSASLVGPNGLIMTNHHCVRPCIEDLTTPERDLLDTGLVAKTRAEELKCTKLEAAQLVAITDVTARMSEATKGAEGASYQAKLKAEQSKIESECAKGDATVRCDVITLFHGARFHLYRYRRFTDVRLVFAAEFIAATFGGDPDNFNFPRYGFDVALLRLYAGDQAVSLPHLSFATRPVKEGELVFTSGHPGGTERSQTIAQLELQRDVILPWLTLMLSEQRGRLSEWMKQSDERTRFAKARLRTVENALKALRGRREALVAPGFLDAKRRAEDELIAKAPEHTKPAWTAVASAVATQRALWPEYAMKEQSQGFQSELYSYARLLLRQSVEKAKPNAERLREHSDAQWPAASQVLLATAPIRKDLEKATLAWSLARLRETFGADDPFVQLVLGPKSPDELADELISSTKLDDPAVRKNILENGGLDDPLIAFAAKIDPAARAIRKRWEDEVEAPLKKNSELLAEARRAVIGATGYPDATGTLRLSYGAVRGTSTAKAMTEAGGLFARATGRPPFLLAPRWEAVRSKLSPLTPFNLATTNDIIGGNSGSPLLDRQGNIVGLVFDGNLASLGGRYGYDGRENRTVAVSAELIISALRHVYGAGELADVLSPKRR